MSWLTKDTQYRFGVLHSAYLPAVERPVTWPRRVGCRRGSRIHAVPFPTAPLRTGLAIFTAPGSPVSFSANSAVVVLRNGCPRGRCGRRSGFCGGVLPSALPIQAVRPDPGRGGLSGGGRGVPLCLFVIRRVHRSRR